jgi:hypothetical protein
MPCSILVVDGESTSAPAVVRCLGHIPGCSVDVLSRRSLTPLRFSRTVRSIHPSTQEPEDRIADIVAVAGRVHPDVCVAVDEPAIRLLATTGRGAAIRVHAAPFVAPLMRACRYVSGSPPARDWLHGRMTFGHAGFGFTDTAFRYALGDPGRLLAELFL